MSKKQFTFIKDTVTPNLKTPIVFNNEIMSNCRELYCKGILDIFNKANSLNQAREMIKEHLE